MSAIYNVQYTLTNGREGNVSIRRNDPESAVMTVRRQLLNTGNRDFVINRVIDEATHQIVWSK